MVPAAGSTEGCRFVCSRSPAVISCGFSSVLHGPYLVFILQKFRGVEVMFFRHFLVIVKDKMLQF